MPLVAKNKITGDRIDITQISSPRATLPQNILICPFCDGEMFVREGFINVPHFAHRVECTSIYVQHGESINHLMAKAGIAKYLRENFQKDANIKVELEVRVPEVRRIADVMLFDSNEGRVAYEIQLSPIATEDLAQRTQDYRRAGIDCLWCLGEKALTANNREWCENNLGDYCVVDVNTEFFCLDQREICVPPQSKN